MPRTLLTKHDPCACSFLPLVAASTAWSPETHAAHPAPFRRAARALLLINICRGFGGGGGAEPAGTAERGIALPLDVLHHILRLAARPMAAWVPVLQLDWRREPPAPRQSSNYALWVGTAVEGVAEVVAGVLAEVGPDALAAAAVTAVGRTVVVLLGLRPWRRIA